MNLRTTIFTIIVVAIMLSTQLLWLYDSYKLKRSEITENIEKDLFDFRVKNFKETKIGKGSFDFLPVEKMVEWMKGEKLLVDTVIIHDIEYKRGSDEMNLVTCEDFSDSFNKEHDYYMEFVPIIHSKQEKLFENGCYYSSHFAIDYPLNVEGQAVVAVSSKQVVSAMKWNIVLSAVTFLTFVMAYFSMMKMYFMQRRMLERKNDFINHLTHEMKTPISVIRSCMNTIGVRHPDEATRQITETCNHEIDAVNEMIMNILTSQRLNLNKVSLNMAETNLVETLDEISARFTLLEGGISINDMTNSGIATCFVTDKEVFTLIITNLIKNALTYCERVPDIRIVISQTPKSLKITVIDNGIGIAEEDRERIFEKFYRVSSLNKVKGSGLGLYIAREMARLVNGQVLLGKSTDEGSEFVLELFLEKIETTD